MEREKSEFILSDISMKSILNIANTVLTNIYIYMILDHSNNGNYRLHSYVIT